MKELADRRGTGAALMRRHGAAELDWLEHSAAMTQGDESRRMAKPNPQVVKALARCVLAGECSAESIAGRLAEVLGRQRRWIAPFVARYIKAFGGKTRPRNREVVAFFLADRRFCRVYDRDLVAMMSVSRFTPVAEMQPVAAAKGWGIPAIRNVGGLAEWLGISLADLEWFADLGQYEFRQDEASKLHHYDYQFRLKASGAYRLIEAPKPRLKDLQRQVLAWMLDRVPSHPATHGFVRGRSIRTFAEPHVGQAVVLRIDLKEFFPSIRAARVQALFRTMGYPEPVADLLGGICTASVPRYALREMRQALPLAEFQQLKTTYRRRHLPQGGPTSPSLANLCAYRMDCRLAGLAEAAGARYTRYADDLAFSGGGEFARSAERFGLHVAAIATEEGFAVNHRKTRVMRKGVRQHLAGLVVNEKVNVDRRYVDELKAILHNCARFGPESQVRGFRGSFREHLLGRIGFVEMVRPEKGARLRRVFDEIRWP
jgi:RNA-directed DNA polymerase